MAYQSAAGQVPERVRVAGNPRPLVTDRAVVVEMPLSQPPSELWLDYLQQRTRSSESPDNVGWVHYRSSQKGEPTITFLLKTGNPDHLNQASQDIERLIEAISDDWQSDDAVVEEVDRQKSINDLQVRLNQVAAIYSRL